MKPPSTADALRSHFHAFGAEHVAPSVRQRDSEGCFDRGLWERMGEAGLFRIGVPVPLGGHGGGLLELGAALEGFAEGSGDLGLSTSVLAHRVAIELLQDSASAAQRERWLPPLLRGSWVAAVANAEPRAGTDILALRSRAVRSAGGWRLTGRKRSITNVGAADLVIASARVEGLAPAEAIHAFVIELPRARAWMRPIRDLIGLRTSPTGNLLLRGAEVPDDALVGAPGSGVALFRRTFSLERLFSGSLFLAAIARSMARSIEFAETRAQFGASIGKNQYVQERIVKMRVAHDVLSATVSKAAAELSADLGGAPRPQAFGALSAIKLYGLEAALESAQGLLRVLGGRGVRRVEAAERMIRDLLTLSIFGGTAELHKIVSYNETVRRHFAGNSPGAALESNVTRAAPLASQDVEIELIEARGIPDALRARLSQLVASALPNQSGLAGGYYYDTEPDRLILARHAGEIVGFRILAERTVLVGTEEVKMAGIGIAVAPAFQRRGVGRMLTARALEHLAARQVELVLAFLFDGAAEALLRAFGFRPLRARVSYLPRDGRGVVEEQSPCYALALGPGEVVEEIESRGELHLGVGIW